MKQKKAVTALGMAQELGIQLDSDNRKSVLKDIRSSLRKIVDTNGGSRDTIANDGQLLYKLE